MCIVLTVLVKLQINSAELISVDCFKKATINKAYIILFVLRFYGPITLWVKNYMNRDDPDQIMHLTSRNQHYCIKSSTARY